MICQLQLINFTNGVLLDIPDHVYNWFIHFFNGHSHCVKFQGDTSTLREINAIV